MDTFVRRGIVALAGTVALGTAGFAVASASASDDDKVAKREDTSTSWVQSTDVDDDPNDGSGNDSLSDRHDDRARAAATLDDSPTDHSANTANTSPSKNTANTANTSPSKNTANTSPSKNTHQSVNTTPSNRS